MSTHITELNEANYNQFLTDNKKVFVMAKAPWCQSCKSMLPTIDDIASNNTDIAFAIIDADQNQSFVMDMGVRNLPTCFMYVEGNEVERFVGPKPKNYIVEFINKA